MERPKIVYREAEQETSSSLVDGGRADTRSRIGLALGGGGLWGIAHIGVIQKLQEEGVPVDMIGGASMGALIGGVACGLVDPETHCFTAEGVAYLRRIAAAVRSFEDIVERVNGETRIVVQRLLCPDGDTAQYEALMARGPVVPCYVQVALRHVSELFLSAQPGDGMERALLIATASAALKPKFGIDPVTVDGVQYLHDNSITRKSVQPVVAKLRAEGATNVIGAPISFMDTGRSDRMLQRLYHALRPARSDLGDVVVRPKLGHGPTNGAACLTNFGKGWALWPEKFARTEAEIGHGRRIAIPTDAYIRYGHEAASRAMPEIDAMLGRR